MGAAKNTDARKLEKFIAKTLGLEETRGSGAVKSDGDAKSPYNHRVNDILPIMVEAKHTQKPSKTFSVTFATIEKAVRDACRRGLVPVLVKQVGEAEPLVVMRLKDFAYIYKTVITMCEEHHGKEKKH